MHTTLHTQTRETTTSDRLTHIVQDRDRVRTAMIEQTPVVALCGRVWVPSRWKPAGGLRCRVCADLAASLYPFGP